MATQPDDSLRAKTWEVYQRLLATYGERPRVPRRDPMHELISTMLSHRTNAKNEDQAYRQMWERFGSWEGIMNAPTDELAEAIAPSNYPESKAPRIQETLRRILAQHPDANIDFLATMPTDEALKWLTDLPGVGVKTATLVLLFVYGHPVLPVDTHLHRVSGRLGLIGPKVSAEAAHTILLSLLPPDDHVLFNFHIDMLRHGQRLCIWGTPRCEKCPLTDICDYYQTVRAPQS